VCEYKGLFADAKLFPKTLLSVSSLAQCMRDSLVSQPLLLFNLSQSNGYRSVTHGAMKDLGQTTGDVSHLIDRKVTGWGQGGEMTQALYAHMNNKTIKKKKEK
jgi:hypothetical protein